MKQGLGISTFILIAFVALIFIGGVGYMNYGSNNPLCTDTPQPPTETNVPPTDTEVPPTYTDVPPTETPVPPTDTPVPPTETLVPPGVEITVVVTHPVAITDTPGVEYTPTSSATSIVSTPTATTWSGFTATPTKYTATPTSTGTVATPTKTSTYMVGSKESKPTELPKTGFGDNIRLLLSLGGIFLMIIFLARFIRWSASRQDKY